MHYTILEHRHKIFSKFTPCNSMQLHNIEIPVDKNGWFLIQLDKHQWDKIKLYVEQNYQKDTRYALIPAKELKSMVKPDMVRLNLQTKQAIGMFINKNLLHSKVLGNGFLNIDTSVFDFFCISQEHLTNKSSLYVNDIMQCIFWKRGFMNVVCGYLKQNI